jgi:maleylacetoacetate isomerase/maleylpyruvate isomerase
VLTLHTYFRSSAAFRVRCALNHKGIAYAPEVVWLPGDEHKSEAYLALNPQGLVPTLIDGPLVLTQSLAIIEYLDETRAGPKLLPADPAGRARTRALAQLVACEIHPINNPRILKYLKNVLGHDQPTVDAWYRHWIAEGLAALECQLGDARTGRYSHGDTVTIADCCLVPQIFNAKRFECPLDAYPTTMRVFDALMQLPAFDAAQPSKQPDAARA